jgi:hypothetical protein
MRQGQGVMLYANGDEYRGEWIEDKQSGHGVMSYKSGDVYYTGMF